ncbi:SRPBCC family protein [Kribbella sp. NBC_01245]|uniref:SRPBCC family protein n=1 Tax=Kribbella sp. NBC_01245 TaxID=2903578 RepID=UPI002E28F6BD|nr:SRPBCC family protein [Kribbella sp. NBC_01245]
MVTNSIEIDRPAGEVFAYLEQFERHSEWQPSLIAAEIKTPGPIQVGTRVVERRKTPVGIRDIPFVVTEHDPPYLLSFRGTTGPVRPVGTATVEVLSEFSSRLTFEVELEGRGIGRLIAPLALRQTAKEIPMRLRGYKKAIEDGTPGPTPR